MAEKKKNIELLKDALIKTKIVELSKKLNVATGTIKRWLELKSVPSSYEFDLLKLCDIKIDYSEYSSKVKDQFFTPRDTSKYCYDIFLKVMKDLKEDVNEYNFIEPSAGDGSFLDVLPKDRTISLDIEPKHDDIIEKDYLTWTPGDNKKYIVFGNPPFGLRGHMALKFINHSVDFADFVCFILPPLFDSDGKGSPRKRVNGFNLVHSEKLISNFYEPGKNEIVINTVFQIWSKSYNNKDYLLDLQLNNNVKIYSLSDGGTSSSTRNKKMLDKCHVYVPSTCFGKENMKAYKKFIELPNKRGYGLLFIENVDNEIEKAMKINWVDISFLSTNSAYNLRTSQIYAALCDDIKNVKKDELEVL
jgi:hypothetical protein